MSNFHQFEVVVGRINICEMHAQNISIVMGFTIFYSSFIRNISRDAQKRRWSLKG